MSMSELDMHKESIGAPRRTIDFLSASQNKDPMLYPGERPSDSYLTDGSLVYDMKVADGENLSFTMTTEHGEVAMNDFLREHGAPSLEDRIPVLAFGANMSPGSLASKFAKVGREDALVIPTAYTTLKGHDVVWSGGPGMNGNFIAVLYDGPEVQDTEVQVGVNFLTREQLLVMNATELAYQLAWADVHIGEHPVRAFYYVGQDQIFIKDGLPVAIESVPATGRSLEASNTSSMLEDVLLDEPVMAKVAEAYPELEGVTTTQEYLEFVGELKAEKRALPLKKVVHAALLEQGHARFSEAADYEQRLASWANPSTLPTLGDQQLGFFHHPIHRLPTQELGEWSDQEARDRLLRSITQHLVRHSGRTTKDL